MLDYFNESFSSIDRPSAKEWLEELEKFTNKKNIQSFRCPKNDNHLILEKVVVIVIFQVNFLQIQV